MSTTASLIPLLPFTKTVPITRTYDHWITRKLAITSFAVSALMVFFNPPFWTGSTALISTMGFAYVPAFFGLIGSVIVLYNTNRWVERDACCNLMRTHPACCARTCASDSNSGHPRSCCCTSLFSLHVTVAVFAALGLLFTALGAAGNVFGWSSGGISHYYADYYHDVGWNYYMHHDYMHASYSSWVTEEPSDWIPTDFAITDDSYCESNQEITNDDLASFDPDVLGKCSPVSGCKSCAYGGPAACYYCQDRFYCDKNNLFCHALEFGDAIPESQSSPDAPDDIQDYKTSYSRHYSPSYSPSQQFGGFAVQVITCILLTVLTGVSSALSFYLLRLERALPPLPMLPQNHMIVMSRQMERFGTNSPPSAFVVSVPVQQNIDDQLKKASEDS